MSDECFSAHRMNRLRAVCSERGLTAFYVRDTTNIRWLTAFDDVFDAEKAHALFVDGYGATLHTDSRYASACRRAAEGSQIVVDDARETHAQFAKRLWEQGSKLGIEDSVSLAEFRKLEAEFPVGCMRETSDIVLSLRAVKDADEVRRLRSAQSITDAAFDHIVRFMRPGMTEREVQLELDGFMLRNGASDLAFPSIVATGANGANPHAIPGESRLEAGQCVVLDFGARAQGYCSDMTRVVFVGEPDARLRDAYRVLRQANEQVAAMLRPGVTGKEAHELAERILADGGYDGKMGHGLGHGVGMDIHEEPVLAPRNDKPLAAGNVVTVEPGIYLPGDFGMRLEDFGIITDEGFDVLTRSSHDMVII